MGSGAISKKTGNYRSKKFDWERIDREARCFAAAVQRGTFDYDLASSAAVAAWRRKRAAFRRKLAVRGTLFEIFARC